MKEQRTGITIRPSSVDSFLQCPQQWYRVFILGETSIPSARAAIGTAVHRGAEVMWQEAMKTRDKNPNIPTLVDAAIAEYKEEEQKGLSYDDGEDANTSHKTIIQGIEAFCDDVVPFVAIPDAVEERYTIKITDHPVVNAVSGTVDYIQGDTIADIKTSKRKPTLANYQIQQSIYKILANANGKNIEHSMIQAVVFKKVTEGTILNMNHEIDENKAKFAVNSILDTTRYMSLDIIDPEVLFRGNPKYYLCSPKYCAFYNDCKFVKGDAPDVSKRIPAIEL